jgi:hypothetical protein
MMSLFNDRYYHVNKFTIKNHLNSLSLQRAAQLSSRARRDNYDTQKAFIQDWIASATPLHRNDKPLRRREAADYGDPASLRAKRGNPVKAFHKSWIA